MNLMHNLLKTYWKWKVPFTDAEIAAGVEDVDVWLCSPGGAGSNMLKDYLHDFVRVKSPYMAGLLTHHSMPEFCGKDNFKAIYLHRHPVEAVKSMKRRGLVKTNIRKLNNTRDLPETDEVLMSSVINQFENWTTMDANYPILCMKYESIFENREQLGEFLGIEMNDFPEPVFSSYDINIEESLIEGYSEEVKKWEQYPDVVLREPVLSK